MHERRGGIEAWSSGQRDPEGAVDIGFELGLCNARSLEVRDVEPLAGEGLLEELAAGRKNDGRFAGIRRGARGDVCVSGPRTRALRKNGVGIARAVILQFKPGWSVPLLGVSAHTLTDQIVPLAEIWGSSARDLGSELLAAQDTQAVPERLSAEMALRRPRTFEPASGRLARRAVRLLEGKEVRVESVASELGVTARHLRRVFTASVGIGPKEFARNARLQRAVQLASTSNDWARIALDAGYYDQAHLIADFRELVGFTPGAFVKRLSASA